ncbi:MAG: branched-chain amino acid transaminase [Patescibacteria group bacterium]|nr:branched-chain amino acid transaminase [Patescibacteria group bacterium]
MITAQNIVFFNGKLIPEEDVKLSVRTHALHYGTGCFEGIRAYYNQKEDTLFIFRMEDHYKRLLQSCKVLFISLPYTIEELCLKTCELVRKNFVQTDIYIRPLAFKSGMAVGSFDLTKIEDSLLIYTVPMGKHLSTEEAKVNISSWTRISDNAISPKAKITGAYVNTCLAKTESALAGYNEALFLDNKGHVVEGSAENIFIVKNGIIVTPPVSDDILQGITRDTVIQLFQEDLGTQVIERSINRTEVYQADEIFLVGTGAEISPVVEVDGRKIGDGSIGKITTQIKNIYYQLVRGKLLKHREFLTKVAP